ncbi:MAG: UDP-3-O-(3-hydroxymyristoyl)glucosamine N-acyltransferase [Saprospiraceae bacterium]|nr:UDP-3-O-(3-hydroxymyristoyl)glucosamine N-acyltransferase [Saprospiraceae bacterium]
MYLSQYIEVSAGRLHEDTNLDEDVLIHGFSPLSETREGTISWSRSEDINWSEIRASVIICPIATPTPPSRSIILVRTESPRKLFAEWLNLFTTSVAPVSGIEKTAVVHPTAKIHDTAYVGHFAVIEEDVVIGERSSVGHHAVVGSKTIIGDDVLLKPHCVLGEGGYGFERDENNIPVRIPHIGWVEIKDHAEVGSFTTVCRGTLGATRIMNHAKVDDHVHIAHNVVINDRAMIVACAEISGSAQIGQDSWVAPGSVIRDAIVVGRDVIIGLGTIVTKDVPDGSIVFGNPGRVREEK